MSSVAKRMDAAVTALRERDATEYRKARAAYHEASAEYDAQSQMLGALGTLHYQALERYLRRVLAPHTVEYQRYHAPSTQKNGSGDVNHADWTSGVHISGEVWPAPKGGRFNMPMRAHVPFSLSPRDGDEFRRMVSALKAAADAMTEAGL